MNCINYCPPPALGLVAGSGLRGWFEAAGNAPFLDLGAHSMGVFLENPKAEHLDTCIFCYVYFPSTKKNLLENSGASEFPYTVTGTQTTQ